MVGNQLAQSKAQPRWIAANPNRTIPDLRKQEDERDAQHVDFTTINAEVSYNGSPRIAINDNKCNVYLMQLFYTYQDKWTLEHDDTQFQPYHYWQSFTTLRNKWKVEIYGIVDDQLTILLRNTYNETGRRVVFVLDSESSSLDAICIKKAIEFQKQTYSFVFVKTRFYKLLKDMGNPFVKVVDLSTDIDNVYSTFNIRQNEILTNQHSDWISDKHWPIRGKAIETFDHQHNWMYYSPERIFDDIVYYE